MDPTSSPSDRRAVPALDVHVTEHTGSHPPVVLLHPWFGCHQMWQPLAARLRRRSYAVDWYSLPPGPGATPAGLTAALIDAMDAHGLAQVDVVGNSVGGIVAQLLASSHPARVRRMVLVGTGASLEGPPTPFGTLVARWLAEPAQQPDLTEALVDALVARPIPAADRVEYLEAVGRAHVDLLASVIRSARDLDLRPLLRSITAPTLVIRGEHDTARTRDHVRELVAGIPDSRAIEMPGCGHSPMIEEPDLFAGLVSSHLDQADGLRDR